MLTTMLYKPGSMITCGNLSLDYIIVSDHEISQNLKLGWFKTPQEAVVKDEEKKETEEKPTRKKAVKDAENQG